MSEELPSPPPTDIVMLVRQSFMIFPVDRFIGPLEPYAVGDTACPKAVSTAIQGLRSVVSAVGLPFLLVQDSAYQRHFHRIHSSERILSLIPVNNGEMNKVEAEQHANAQADARMREFIHSDEGMDSIRDDIVYALNRHLKSNEVAAAANELLIQTLISTWSIFESFSRSLIVQMVNENPRIAAPILNSTELKDFFGKQVVDIQTIGEHSFDLSNSMGDIIFRGRRLDSLGIIKSIFKTIFSSSDVQSAVGELWMLNQRRHLFVHNRGIVDKEYIRISGDSSSIGKRLSLKSNDIEDHLIAVQRAIIAISSAAQAV